MKKPQYRVFIDLSNAQTHRANIRIEEAAEKLPGVIEFPVWTPGSYMVREYSRHITTLEPATKIAKNKWHLASNTKEISYDVYCFERTVRTSYLDENYAALVGATLLPLLAGPFTVELKLPSHWKILSSALKFRSLGKSRYIAEVRDRDHWIDCPIVASAPGFGGIGKFRVGGITHHIAWVGLECARHMKDLEDSFKKIANTTLKFFGGAPFKEYWFLLQFGYKLYGGLEHRDSQLSQFDGANLNDQKSWDAFLRLIAHEYFHSWNVKSIRPKALGPFDYHQENYTEDLWFAEGITDYFDDMIPLFAGLISQDAYARARLKDVSQLPDGIPAHRRRSLAETSFDAWIRHYRGDEDTMNTDVTYYSKGALLGWCWDAHLQKKSKGKWNLAKLMRAIWKEFGIDAYEDLTLAKPGFTRAELFAFAEKITHVKQAKLIEGWIKDRKPLPWREAAKTFHIKYSENISDFSLHHLGCQLNFGNSPTVKTVASHGAAEDAGISPQDEILAINSTRVSDQEKTINTIKKAMKSGKKIELLLCRGDKILKRNIVWKKHSNLGIELGLKS
jgi:predicted metalloprotease with PDZ domain